MRIQDASYQTKTEIKHTFSDVVQALDSIVSLQKDLSDTCPIHSYDIHSLMTWNQFFKLASSVKMMTPQLLNPECLHESLEVIHTLQAQCTDICQLKNDFNASFNRMIDLLDASSYPIVNELYHKNIDIINKRADVFDDDDIQKLSDIFNQMLSTLREKKVDIVTRRTELKVTFNDEIFHLNAELYAHKLSHQFKGAFSRLFSSEYRKIINELHGCHKNGDTLSYQDALFIMQKLADDQHKVAEFKTMQSPLQSIFGYIDKGIDTDWNQVSVQIHRKIIEFHQMLADFRQKKSAFDQAQSSLQNLCGCTFQGLDTDWTQVADQLHELEPLLAQNIDVDALLSCRDFSEMPCVFAENHKKISNVLTEQTLQRMRSVADYFDCDAIDIFSEPCLALLERFNRCLDEMDKLNQWCHFQKLLDRLSEKQVVPYLQAAIALSIEPEKIVGAFQKHIYYLWIDRILSQSPALSAFNRIAQDGAIQTFAEKDRLQFLINRAIIRAELCAKRPSANRMLPGSAVSLLLCEGEKKRKQKSIRALLSEAGNAVQRIKPCFLMSPLSVSTFLDPDAVAFDVVIFDEASQIFPQDGIGAIYRAKQLIVVGDSKQMPPSNFFSSVIESDEDDEETGDVTDFESILDMCSTAMTQLRLRWHYRSRFEQLITFSNKNFYDDTLVTFPSSRADAPGCGIDYDYVNGVFDRKTRTNLKEAERIVDLIYRHIEQYPNRSLGVVAFSISQQSLIENLLLKRRLATPQCEFFFQTNGNEPFFIKNLETVQGDERDTILFSVAYGFDKQGNFLHNFGPLNRVGGERRLNVAVTRAKCNVQLVASIHYTDIDLNRTKAEGAKLLREYLDFAENGSIALSRASKPSNRPRSDSKFECEVREFLKNKGFNVEANVGCSACRVDIGLKQPNSSDYLLAIECDGDTYRAAKNTRDRDRLRREILERMGWQYHRVWSTEWFKNQSQEQQRLLDAVNRALHPSEESEKKTATSFNEDAFEIPFVPQTIETMCPDASNALPQRSVTTDICTHAMERSETMAAHPENTIAISKNDDVVAQNDMAMSATDVAASANDVTVSDNAVALPEKTVALPEKTAAFIPNDDVSHNDSAVSDNDISRFEIYETRTARESRNAVQLWIKNILEQKSLEDISKKDPNQWYTAYERISSEELFNYKQYKTFGALLRAVIKAEAPIAESYLLSCTCWYLGREKVTSVVKGSYEEAMYDCLHHGIGRQDGFVYCLDQQTLDFRFGGLRKFVQIPPVELAVGMIDILKREAPIKKNELFGMIAKMCSVRLNSSNIDIMENAFKLISDKVLTNKRNDLALQSKSINDETIFLFSKK